MAYPSFLFAEHGGFWNGQDCASLATWHPTLTLDLGANRRLSGAEYVTTYHLLFAGFYSRATLNLWWSTLIDDLEWLRQRYGLAPFDYPCPCRVSEPPGPALCADFVLHPGDGSHGLLLEHSYDYYVSWREFAWFLDTFLRVDEPDSFRQWHMLVYVLSTLDPEHVEHVSESDVRVAGVLRLVHVPRHFTWTPSPPWTRSL